MVRLSYILIYSILTLLFLYIITKIILLEKSKYNYEFFRGSNQNSNNVISPNYDILKEGHKQCLLQCKKLKDQGNYLRKKKNKKKKKANNNNNNKNTSCPIPQSQPLMTLQPLQPLQHCQMNQQSPYMGQIPPTPGVNRTII